MTDASLPNDTLPAERPAPSRLPAETDLPDPLATFDGETVETPTEWTERRRPELRRLFEHYVYGYAPGKPTLDVDRESSESVFDGLGTLTELTVRFAELPDDAPTIDLALFTPAASDAVPVFLGLNRVGNHAVVDDDAVTVTDSGSEFGADERGAKRDFWCVERILRRGYGFATFHHADVDPDRDAFEDGIRAHYRNLPGPPEAHWGTLAAWAWGLRRGVDALRDEPTVREDAVALVGHSRRGKAALLAAAFDERVAMVVPHQSGTGGCAPSRDNGQETVAAINETFPHWFNDVFPAFAGRTERLPVDQHLLLALVAPRPLLDTEGARDYWANPGRAYDAVRAAAPVYELLGADGMVGKGLLSGDDSITPETVGELVQYRRETEHTMDDGYWDAILDFADVHLG